MNVDLELVRLILIEVDHMNADMTFCPLRVEGYSLQTVSVHVQMLGQAGLIKAMEYPTSGHIWFVPLYLTPTGQRMLKHTHPLHAWQRLCSGSQITEELPLETAAACFQGIEIPR